MNDFKEMQQGPSTYHPQQETLDTVRMFMEIMNTNDKIVAQRELERFGFDLQLAIEGCLRDNKEQQLQQQQSQIPASGPDRSSFSSSSFISPGCCQSVETTTMAALSAKIPFADSEFPPDSSSLDGRASNHQIPNAGAILQQSNNDNNDEEDCWDERKRDSHQQQQPTPAAANPPLLSKSAQTAVLCHCGLVASAKRAQSDGPNYGRFYLACGKKATIPSRRQHRQKQLDRRNQKDPKTNGKEDAAAIITPTKTTSLDTVDETTKMIVKNPYRRQLVTRENMSSPQRNQIRNNDTNNPCNFFQWDTVDGTLGSACCGYNMKRWSERFSWHCFHNSSNDNHGGISNLWSHCGNSRQRNIHDDSGKMESDQSVASLPLFRPEHVRQGAVGNCWFLSALAVVAEHPHLLQQILTPYRLASNVASQDSKNKRNFQSHQENLGRYRVNLCLHGQWTEVVVDAYLPVVSVEPNTNRATATRKRRRDGILVQQPHHHRNHDYPSNEQQSYAAAAAVIVPAFCDVPNRGTLLSPALIEKAYAKAHGCYANLSGGFIAEAFADLTGAPTETIIFEQHVASSMCDATFEAKDQLWAMLLSFAEAGFLMGVATSRGGDGLVGGHAYSVLDVLEFHDSLVGEQQKVTDFFSKTTTVSVEQLDKTCDKNGHHKLEPKKGITKEGYNERLLKRETIRLVRIRNPWGQKEWKGAWSADSDRWTRTLRNQLCDSYSKGDGTFFMSFNDMLNRFHHMDVAKCRKDWVHHSVEGCFIQGVEPMESSKFQYWIVPTTKTWAFISLIQPKKRANTKASYWYSDASFMLLKRPKASGESWMCEACILQGVTPRCDSEVFLEPTNEYCCFPFSYAPNNSALFRLVFYSSSPVRIELHPNSVVNDFILNLHKELMRNERKLTYCVASSALLVCVQGNGCLYFVGVNGSECSYLSMRITIEIKQGVNIVFGRNCDTHDISPRSQKVLAVLSRDGKFSTLTELTFHYISDVIPRQTTRHSAGFRDHSRYLGAGASIEITLAGDLLTTGLEGRVMAQRGGDSIDLFHWVPQVGASL